MDLKTLIKKLEAMGFIRRGDGAYRTTTRFSHPSVRGGSVFIGDCEAVSYPTLRDETPLKGNGAFLIANGRGRGMTRALRDLECKPTWSIEDPFGRPPLDDDPYWRGEALVQLLDAMKRHFRR